MKSVSNWFKKAPLWVITVLLWEPVWSLAKQQLELLPLWQRIVLGVVLAALLLALGKATDVLYRKWEKRRKESSRSKAEQCGMELEGAALREFCKVQLKKYFDSQSDLELEKALSALALEDQLRQALCAKREKAIDDSVTTGQIIELLETHFASRCKIGSEYANLMGCIRMSWTALDQWKRDGQTALARSIRELAALNDLHRFLSYLDGLGWDHPEKENFLQEQIRLIGEQKQSLEKDLTEEEKAQLYAESARINYLQSLVSASDRNAAEYIPLDYKAHDNTSLHYTLEELDSLEGNEKGFVLFADAGYGKSWSVTKLAGECARAALTGTRRRTPVLIEMRYVTGGENPIAQEVQKKLFSEDRDLSRANAFLKNEHVVLYVDGMDEAENSVKETVRRELGDLLNTCSHLRLIGGTRRSDLPRYPETLRRFSIDDLTENKIRAFIVKQLPQEEKQRLALEMYFENRATGFLQNLKSPFYLKCFVEFVEEGGTSLESEKKLIEQCMEKMIQREIGKTGGNITAAEMMQFLRHLYLILGEKQYLEISAIKGALRQIDGAERLWENFDQIRETLTEQRILREVDPVLGFAHEKYRQICSPVKAEEVLW